MPKLGDFIGALLSDAAQARVRADLEAVRIAEAYSGHELLKHLPVPRFRMPDITVDVPVLISSVEGIDDTSGGRLFGQPTSAEITKVVRTGLSSSGIKLSRTEVASVSKAAAERVSAPFETGPQMLLRQARAASEVTASVVGSVKRLERDVPDERLRALETATKASLTSLLSTKLLQSPYLEVIVTASEIKAHEDTESVVRVRLSISEDAYEVVERDDGQGYYLTPE